LNRLSNHVWKNYSQWKKKSSTIAVYMYIPWINQNAKNIPLYNLNKLFVTTQLSMNYILLQLPKDTKHIPSIYCTGLWLAKKVQRPWGVFCVRKKQYDGPASHILYMATCKYLAHPLPGWSNRTVDIPKFATFIGATYVVHTYIYLSICGSLLKK
jgi:hypothetical protein